MQVTGNEEDMLEFVQLLYFQPHFEHQLACIRYNAVDACYVSLHESNKVLSKLLSYSCRGHLFRLNILRNVMYPARGRMKRNVANSVISNVAAFVRNDVEGLHA